MSQCIVAWADRIGSILAVASLAVTVLSGAVVGLFYYPSSEPIGGRLYRAETAVIDAAGDTVLRGGDLAFLDTIPPYRGVLRAVGDSTLQWNTALVSFASIVASKPGASLVKIHRTASSVFVASLAVILCTIVLKGYRQWRKELIVVPMLIGAMVTAWIGTVLPLDQRALDAYMVGRSFLAENLPVVGDVVAILLPLPIDIARVFLLHAVWIPALLVTGAILVRHYRQWAGNEITIGAAALVIVVVGMLIALLNPPDVIATEAAPIWHLGVPFALLHVLPMDATMLVVLFWWSSAIACGRSHRTWVRVLGSCLIAIWFIAGLVIIIVGE